MYTDTQAKGGGIARSKVSAFQSYQIQAESSDCSDDKFINKQISTSRPIRHSITMVTWPIIFCPTENHSVTGWSVAGRRGCVLHWGKGLCSHPSTLHLWQEVSTAIFIESTSENLTTCFGHQKRVLKLGRTFPISSNSCPTIWPRLILPTTCTKERDKFTNVQAFLKEKTIWCVQTY